MKDYQAIRAAGEELLSATGVKCSFVRPWYVLGTLMANIINARVLDIFPGALAREQVLQQGLVTIKQIVAALVYAVKNPPMAQVQIFNIPDIRKRSGN